MSKWSRGGNLYWRRDQFFAPMTAYQARSVNQFQIDDLVDEPIESKRQIQTQQVVYRSPAVQAFNIINRLSGVTPPDEVYGIQLGAVSNNLAQKRAVSTHAFNILNRIAGVTPTDEVYGIRIHSMTNNLRHKPVANNSYLYRVAQVPQITDELYGITIISYPRQVVYKRVSNSIFFKLNVPPLTDEVHGIRISSMPDKVLYRRTSREAYSKGFNKLQVPNLEFPAIGIQEIGRRLVRKVAANGAFVTASRFVVADALDEALPEGITLIPHIVYQTPRGTVQSYLVVTRLASLEVIFPISFTNTADPIVTRTQYESSSMANSEDGIVITTEVP